MVGPTKHFNTRQDLMNMLELYPEQTKQWLQDQYDNRFIWYTVKPSLYMAGDEYTEIVDGEPVTMTRTEDEPWEESETSQVVEMTDEEGNVTGRSGLTYMVDPNHFVTSRLLSWDEVVAILEG